MKLSKIERITFVFCPWMFGIFLCSCAIILSLTRGGGLDTLLLICAGLTAISIYCVCSLLEKILEK